MFVKIFTPMRTVALKMIAFPAAKLCTAKLAVEFPTRCNPKSATGSFKFGISYYACHFIQDRPFTIFKNLFTVNDNFVDSIHDVSA